AQRVSWAFAVLELATVGLLALIMYEHQPTALPLPNPTQDPVFGAIVVYLTGALVGVFNWAFQESGTTRAVEDYGLFRTQLLLSMGLSGVAAVGGVVVTVMFAGSLNPSAFVPRQQTVTPTVAASTPTPTVSTPSVLPR